MLNYTRIDFPPADAPSQEDVADYLAFTFADMDVHRADYSFEHGQWSVEVEFTNGDLKTYAIHEDGRPTHFTLEDL